MKKLVLAALAATLVAGFAADSASAAPRRVQETTVQTPARSYNDGVRDSYNAFGGNFDRPAYDARVRGGAISAPAGR